MKKLMLLSLLIMGCDYAPTEHTHTDIDALKTVANGVNKLKNKDQITIHNIKFIPNKKRKNIEKYKATKKELSATSDMFVENNDNFVVINKPSGIAVQAGTKSRKNIFFV